MPALLQHCVPFYTDAVETHLGTQCGAVGYQECANVGNQNDR